MGDVRIDSHTLARLRALQAEKNIENRRNEALREELIVAYVMAEQAGALVIELRSDLEQYASERNRLAELFHAAEKYRNDARAALAFVANERDDARAELATTRAELATTRVELAAARKRKGAP